MGRFRLDTPTERLKSRVLSMKFRIFSAKVVFHCRSTESALKIDKKISENVGGYTSIHPIISIGSNMNPSDLNSSSHSVDVMQNPRVIFCALSSSYTTYIIWWVSRKRRKPKWFYSCARLYFSRLWRWNERERNLFIYLRVYAEHKKN